MEIIDKKTISDLTDYVNKKSLLKNLNEDFRYLLEFNSKTDKFLFYKIIDNKIENQKNTIIVNTKSLVNSKNDVLYFIISKGKDRKVLIPSIKHSIYNRIKLNSYTVERTPCLTF